MAITDNGEVYGWGDNSIGQLGIRKNCEKELTPQWIDLEGHVIGNSCLNKTVKEEVNDKTKWNR